MADALHFRPEAAEKHVEVNMPKKPALKKVKKTATALKRKVAAKAKAGPVKAKAAVARKTMKKPAAIVGKEESKRGFMWRLLERKKDEMKAKMEKAASFGLKDWESHGVQASHGFGRFHGPRRKAG